MSLKSLSLIRGTFLANSSSENRSSSSLAEVFFELLLLSLSEVLGTSISTTFLRFFGFVLRGVLVREELFRWRGGDEEGEREVEIRGLSRGLGLTTM